MSEEKLWSVDLDLNSYRNILFRCAEEDIEEQVALFVKNEVLEGNGGCGFHSYEEGDPNNTVMEVIQASAYGLEQRHTQDGSEIKEVSS